MLVFDDAARAITSAIAIDDVDSDYLTRATIYAHLGRYEQAIADFSKYEEIEPQNVELHRLRGQMHLLHGNNLGASEDFSELITVQPKQWVPRAQRALAYYELGRFEGAVADLKAAIDLGAGDHRAWYRLALIQVLEGDREGYRETCSSMLRHFADTESSMIATFTAWCPSLMPDAVEDYEPFIELGRKAASASPDNPRCHRALGAVLLRAGHIDEAIRELQRGNELLDLGSVLRNIFPARTDYPASTWYFLALAHHARGDREEARAWFDKAAVWTERAMRNHESQDGPWQPWNIRAACRLLNAEVEQALATDE